MTPSELHTWLRGVAANRLSLSVMIWGPPGVGKSTIVAQVAAERGIALVDLRLSQLAPTDLRGLPVPENGISRWFPPEFLPRDGEGILFLDEINMAPPAMQGVAQQLILDRRIGSYRVPDGWLIWAAGNRKADRAAVFEMPSALANRFVHLEIAPDLESFRHWGIAHGISERILSFLSFRPSLLHGIDPERPAWPSPRSWAMANALLNADLAIAPAVGEPAAGEFVAYNEVYANLPDLDQILEGGSAIAFPTEPSARYAVVLGLVVRMASAEQMLNALRWMIENAGREWVQLFVSDAFRLLRERGQFGAVARQLAADPRLTSFAQEFRDLLFA
jgi:hypothetical protein